MMMVSRSRPAVVLLLVLLAACGGARDAGGPPPIGQGEGASHPSAGRVAPDFTAQDPAGMWLPKSSLKGKPLVLLLFRPGAPMAADLARALGRMRDDPAYGGNVFLGLARASLDEIRQFQRVQGITLPVMRDPGNIATAYEVTDLPTIVAIDAGGIIRFRLDGFVGARFEPRLAATAAFLRTLPGLTAATARPLDLDYTRDPRAPVFAAAAIDGRPIDLAKLRGKVVVLIAFDQECPHCQKDFPRLLPVLRELAPRGVVAIGLTARDVNGTLPGFLREQRFDFPVILDRERAILGRYDSSRTPDIFFIDRDGLMRFRETGDRPDRTALTRLQLRILLGEQPLAIAASLPAAAYSGDGACRACHVREYRDWLLTPHSIAWDSLAAGDKWRDPECVRCHVTGIKHPGGSPIRTRRPRWSTSSARSATASAAGTRAARPRRRPPTRRPWRRSAPAVTPGSSSSTST